MHTTGQNIVLIIGCAAIGCLAWFRADEPRVVVECLVTASIMGALIGLVGWVQSLPLSLEEQNAQTASPPREVDQREADTDDSHT